MDAAYARVRAAGVQPISLNGPETLPERNGGVRAFKFRDPDDHPLELWLDGAAGAVVRITGLQAAAPQGPGIEFLRYERPATGRPGAGIRADDAAHAHLTLVVDGLQEILAAPEAQHFSASALYLNDNVCSASIVDPDGHVLVLEEKTPPPSFSACGMVMSRTR